MTVKSSLREYNSRITYPNVDNIDSRLTTLVELGDKMSPQGESVQNDVKKLGVVLESSSLKMLKRKYERPSNA